MNAPTVKLTVNDCTSGCYGAGDPSYSNPLPLSKRCGGDKASSDFKTVTVTRLGKYVFNRTGLNVTEHVRKSKL